MTNLSARCEMSYSCLPLCCIIICLIMAAAVAENLQLKAFILILFSSLASKGLQTPKVEKYLSYIESHLARMETSLKDYIIFTLFGLLQYANEIEKNHY